MDKGSSRLLEHWQNKRILHISRSMNNVENATRTFPSGAAWVDGQEVDADWAIPYVEYGAYAASLRLPLVSQQ